MTIPYQSDYLDAIPEPLRHLYIETDGKFRLNVDGLPDAPGLKSALQTERELNRAIKKSHLAGRTAQQISDAFIDVDALADRSARLDTLMTQREQKITGDNARLIAERDDALSIARTALIEGTLTAAVTQAGANQSGRELIPDFYKDRVRLDIQDGKAVARILNQAGGEPIEGATFSVITNDARVRFPTLFE